DDLFYIQSMTKPIITAAFMMLYEEGHFELTDPVHKYLPEFKNLQVMLNPEAGRDSPLTDLESDITIEHLLTHTAGFSHGLAPTDFEREMMQAIFMSPHETIQDRVQTLLTFPLIGQPGEQWYYSAAPDILSVLIEKFSGKSTPEFLNERIFGPLEMDRTFYNVPASLSAEIVKNHGYNENGSLQTTEFQPASTDVTVWSGVNGLYSTVDDYFKFCQMMLNGGSLNGNHLLSRKTIEIMTMNQTGTLFGGDGTGFGLGFAVVYDLAETDNLGSEGMYFWGGAYNTHFYIDPEEKIISLFFTQLEPYNNFYHMKLRQMVYQALIE
ncbi:MAG: serine hydrolase, partial [Cyclobacteriaceae bacterium]